MTASASPLAVAVVGVGHSYDVIALCVGSIDHPSNMEWPPREDHALKTKFDMMKCQIRRSAARQAP